MTSQLTLTQQRSTLSSKVESFVLKAERKLQVALATGGAGHRYSQCSGRLATFTHEVKLDMLPQRTLMTWQHWHDL